MCDDVVFCELCDNETEEDFSIPCGKHKNSFLSVCFKCYTDWENDVVVWNEDTQSYEAKK